MTADTPLLGRDGRAVGAVSLVVGGALIVVGGILHPHVPVTLEAQMDVIRSVARWAPVHWLLTLALAGTLPGLAAFADRHRRPDGNGRLVAGALLVGLGVVTGLLGTAASASALLAAAEAGDVARYAVVNAWTLALGWLAAVTGAAGAVLMGAHLLRSGNAAGSARATGATLAAGGVAFLAAAASHAPTAAWTHAYLLRYGAVVVGALFVALGVELTLTLRRSHG